MTLAISMIWSMILTAAIGICSLLIAFVKIIDQIIELVKVIEAEHVEERFSFLRGCRQFRVTG